MLFRSSSFSLFNIFGVNEILGGSFIRNLSLSSEIPKSLNTIVAVGASYNPGSISKEATSFSSYNIGLKDRIIPERVDKYNSEEKPEEIDKTPTLEEIINTVYLEEAPYINASPENVKTLTTRYQDEANKKINKFSTPGPYQQISAPFFLPLNLSLEMDGLSGMVLYQKFKISDDILPPSYQKDKMDLLIKGINHTVDVNGWVTKIDTITGPAFKRGELPVIEIVEYNETKMPLESLGPPIENYIPPPSPSSPSRREAMLESYTSVFNRDGENGTLCARYVYNLAINYKGWLSDESIKPNQLAAGGNANQNVEFYQNLKKLGYSQNKVATNVSKDRLKTLINSTVFEYGDIIAYFATDPPLSGKNTHYVYGHTQIYVGDINGSGWASSKKENYNTNFVYNIRLSDRWILYIFRAPSE